MAAFKDRILELRESNGLNKTEMAKRLGLNKSSITRFEEGNIKPSMDLVMQISQEFGVSMDWLAGMDTKERIDYDAIIKECIDAGISTERLKKAIELMKG